MFLWVISILIAFICVTGLTGIVCIAYDEIDFKKGSVFDKLAFINATILAGVICIAGFGSTVYIIYLILKGFI